STPTQSTAGFSPLVPLAMRKFTSCACALSVAAAAVASSAASSASGIRRQKHLMSALQKLKISRRRLNQDRPAVKSRRLKHAQYQTNADEEHGQRQPADDPFAADPAR